ncbi:MAG: hypothetical protein HY951_06425 [Bacteroidia bacterium]|nr:hypothetical protein [Bacteroidia bacterium]
MEYLKIFENWADYDNLKKKKTDSNFFSCEEKWEIEYLRGKIKEIYPSIDDEKIILAIKVCCSTIAPPRPRKDFIICVLRRLGIIK